MKLSLRSRLVLSFLSVIALTAGLVVGTVLLVLTVPTFVSFLPTRKIAKLEPTEALRGKVT